MSGEIHLAWISSLPPRRCGLASYSHAMLGAIRALRPDKHLALAAIEEEGSAFHISKEGIHVPQGSAEALTACAELIASSPAKIVMLQHEFGLYGRWGKCYKDYLWGFLQRLRKPLATTLHSVLSDPDPGAAATLKRLVDASVATIVLSRGARDMLCSKCGNNSRIHVIPHGMGEQLATPQSMARHCLALPNRPVLLSIGFLHPRKGVEYVLDALPSIRRVFPDILYLIVGDMTKSTNPKIMNYVTALRQRIADLSLEPNVWLTTAYVDERALWLYLSAADIVMTTYPNLHQTSSGILAAAMSAGRPIISSRYVHAEEALSDGRGLLVEHKNPNDIAQAAALILRNEDAQIRIHRALKDYSRRRSWRRVADATLSVLENSLDSRVRVISFD